MSVLSERALRHAEKAEALAVNPLRPPGSEEYHATLASAYASLAVAEELGRFEAVAVEERTP